MTLIPPKHPAYTYLKGNIYYFSRVIPADLKSYYSRPRVIQSLRTTNRRDGIAMAKAAGKYKGKAPLKQELKNQVINLFKSGTRQVDIINQLGLGRTSVHSILKAAGLK